MKVHEIISEGQNRKPLRKSIKQSMSNLTTYDQLDNNNKPYLAYRFGVALAPSPDGPDMAKLGSIASNFTIADYTDAETKIRRGAEKRMGIKPSRTTGKGSKELDSTNVKSPVATPKRDINGK